MASSEPAGLLPDKLPGLDDFVVSEVLNDGKDGGVVALLGTFKGCASPARQPGYNTSTLSDGAGSKPW